MGKIRDTVEIWWYCLTKKQQKEICKKYYDVCYGNYLSDMEYHDMENLWIRFGYQYPIDTKKIEKVTRKIKLKKISEK